MPQFTYSLAAACAALLAGAPLAGSAAAADA